jgi:hypothetical protein
VESVEKFVTQKRVLPGQRIPRIPFDVFKRASNLQRGTVVTQLPDSKFMPDSCRKIQDSG